MVEPGLTVIDEPSVPFDQTYDDAPLAVNVVEPPAQIILLPFIAILGLALTVTVLEALALQPFVVPVTEYVVVEPGLTVMDEPVAPVDQVYDDAPLAVRVVELPAQIVFVPVIATLGIPLTVILIVAVF